MCCLGCLTTPQRAPNAATRAGTNHCNRHYHTRVGLAKACGYNAHPARAEACTHTHAHTRTHMHACTHARVHTHACTRAHTRTHVRVHARTHARPTAHTTARANAHANACALAHMRLPVQERAGVIFQLANFLGLVQVCLGIWGTQQIYKKSAQTLSSSSQICSQMEYH